MIKSRGLVAVFTVLLLAALAPTAAAQSDGEIELLPVDVVVFDVSSVAPADWPHIGLGQYARGTPPQDWTLLALQSIPGVPDDVISALRTQLAIAEDLRPTDEMATPGFEWTLYRFDTALPDPVSGEAAIANDGDTNYLVLLLATPDEFDGLRSAVFLPAIEAYAPLAPEPTTDPAALGYQVEEVAFAGGSADVELAATLTLPDGPGPHPVVLLISGSGGQDRDETLKPAAALKPFALIADALTSAGVGVLRYDDRGVAGSTGSRAGLTLDEIASDASAALDFLEGRDDVDPGRIGLLGHSEGGLVSAKLGASDDRVSFIVDMAGPAAPGMDVLRAQNEAILRAGGQDEDIITSYGAFLAEFYPLVLESDEEAAVALATEYFTSLWDLMSEDVRELAGGEDEFVQRQVDGLVDPLIRDPDGAPWFRSFFAYDPGPDWSQITVPVLGLFGGKDVQVLAEQNEPALRAALDAAGNQDYEVVVLPDANHLFQAAESGAITEYSALEPAFTADFLPTIVDWVAMRAGVAE